MARFNPVVPNAQLGIVNIADHSLRTTAGQRASRKGYAQLGMQLKQQEAQLGMQREAQAHRQAMAEESQLAKAQGMQIKQQELNKEQQEAILDGATDVWSQVKDQPLEVQQDALAGYTMNLLQRGQISKQQATTMAQQLQNPQGMQALGNELSGRLMRMQKGGYSSSSTKGITTFRNPDTGEIKRVGNIGGQDTDLMSKQPIKPGDLDGWETIGTGESYQRAVGKKQAGISADTVTGYKEAAVTARKLKPKISLMRKAAEKADFGAAATPILAMKRLGMAFNDIAGQDLIPLDEASVASGELINAIAPDLALEFTARTKGAISDREMAMFIQAVPELTKTKEGYLLVTEMMDKLATRAMDADKFINRQVRSSGGKIPFDIEERVVEHFQDRPVFTEADLEKMFSPTEEVPKTTDGMKQIGTSGGKPVYEDADGNRWVGE